MDKLTKYNSVPLENIDVDEDGKTYVVKGGMRLYQICGTRLGRTKGFVCGNDIIEGTRKCQHHVVKAVKLLDIEGDVP